MNSEPDYDDDLDIEPCEFILEGFINIAYCEEHGEVIIVDRWSQQHFPPEKRRRMSKGLINLAAQLEKGNAEEVPMNEVSPTQPHLRFTYDIFT